MKVWMALVGALLVASALACTRAPEIGTRSGSPLDDLPDWITPLVSPGLRPDWSPDGTKLLYLDALVGNVFERDLETGDTRPLTAHFEHEGFTRARYLANGDLLLCGPRGVPDDAEDGSRWQTELWYLPRDAGTPARALGERCFEGPAVSHTDLRIAWTISDYPDSVVFGRSEIWTGRIELDQNGTATLVERTKRVDRGDFGQLAFLETQDFRPPEDRELLFTAYAWKGGEVMSVDLESGEITNHSNDWGYEETEGVFPDGRSTAVERELDTYTAVPKGDIDIWQLALDGSNAWKQLTHFTEYEGFGANNPVISPDGKTMAFGLRRKSGGHGNADGILLYHFDRAP